MSLIQLLIRMLERPWRSVAFSLRVSVAISSLEKNVSELPELPPSTTSFLLKMKKALTKGNPTCQVPLPDIDKFSCTLVQDSCKIWQRLYNKTPSPFSVNDLSEAFWARKSWPLLIELLDDMDNLFMIESDVTLIGDITPILKRQESKLGGSLIWSSVMWYL